MTDASLIDLESLPAPVVVEQLDFETILARKLQTFLSVAPEFDTLVESDPAIKLLESDAYDELVLRQRINDAARARLLAFATGSDLDQLAAFYGVFRLTGESDEQFKPRVRLGIASKSAAGTIARYKFYALSASVDVLDANVDSPSGGHVRISVLSRFGDGTASDELLNIVRAVVISDDVYALCHTVTVVSAEIVNVNVSANVYLTPTANPAIFDGLPDVLRSAFSIVRSLGYNVAPSWIISRLQVGGVQRIEGMMLSPQTVIAPNQCAKLNNINLVLAGRDY